MHKPFDGAVPAENLLQVGGFLNYNGVTVYATIIRIQSKLFNKKNFLIYTPAVDYLQAWKQQVLFTRNPEEFMPKGI